MSEIWVQLGLVIVLVIILIGITLAGFLASAEAAVSLAEPLEEPLGFLGAAVGPSSVVVVTLVLAYFMLVFGELATKRVAMQKAERWGLLMVRPLAFLSKRTRPVVWLLSHSTDIAVQRRIIDGEFEIAERTLDEILVPRREVFVIDAPWSGREALARLAESGHSRAPVGAGASPDQVTGAVHLRQLLCAGGEPVADRWLPDR
jgi:putative hemolysin